MTYCGANCEACPYKTTCKGCMATEGRPFGKMCIAAECIKKGGMDSYRSYKEQLIAEFNALHVPNMPKVTALVEVMGSYVNLEYTLPNGHKVKLLEDDKVYLGYQQEQENSDRCFGLVADENYLLVCEYGCNGADPKIIRYCERVRGGK